MPAPPGIAGPPKRDPNLAVYLSLFLLVLAFFILLAAISHQDLRRGGAAVDSLNEAFRRTASDAESDAAAGDAGRPAAPGTALGPNAPAARLGRVLETDLPLARIEVLQQGDLIKIVLPLESLFRPGAARLRPNSERLLEAMADVLGDTASPYALEINLGGTLDMPAASAGGPAGGGSPAQLTLNRAGALARDLRGRGVAAVALSVGVGSGEPGTVQFRFVARLRGGVAPAEQPR